MSKTRRKVIFVKVLIVIMVIIGLLVALAAVRQDQVKKHINAQYQTLQLPAQLTLQNSSWNGSNIDTSSSWTYTYTAKGQRSEIFNALENDLKNSGYSITFANTASQDYITARNTNRKLSLTIELLPHPPDSQDTTSLLESVSINAEELPK